MIAIRRPRCTGMLAVCVLVLAGCGGSTDDGDSRSAATPSTTSTTASSSSTGLPPLEGPLVIAHRGASGYAPEHTFAAYDLALEQGADYLEHDLQMTADGELVVLHDEVLDRTARGPTESCTGSVSSKTLDQLRQCEVGSWFNEAYPERADPAFEGLPIPTLREVIDRYGPDVRYYIETKSPEAQPGLEEALLSLLEETGLTDGDTGDQRVIIQSFSADSLRLIHSLEPDLPLVQLIKVSPTPVDVGVLDEAMAYAMGIGPSSANADESLITAAHERCLEVHPYTVDEPAEIASLFGLGADGVFTNRPDVALEARAAATGTPSSKVATAC